MGKCPLELLFSAVATLGSHPFPCPHEDRADGDDLSTVSGRFGKTVNLKLGLGKAGASGGKAAGDRSGMILASHSACPRLFHQPGCGSKIGTLNGALANGTND